MLKSNTFYVQRPVTYSPDGKKRLLDRHSAAVNHVVAEANALVRERDRLLSEISDAKLRETASR